MKENNKWKYQGDGRYERVYERMQFLGIQDVTTNRQHKNGTIVWKLPIKNHDNRNPSYIEVASFASGYVRNQNSGYSNYQLNKRCEGEPEYFDSGRLDELGRPMYTKFTTRSCVLIPIEIDRLEYLISYCLKNYYIKRANQVVEGKYVSQWYHDWSLERANETYSENTGAMARINDLEEKLDAMTEDRDCKSDRVINLSLQYEVLQNKLATIKRISE
jgi:lipopolysaccharide export LptBFGC system permease protein LptF